MQASAGFGLAPRTIGELLDLTFRVFRARFRVFATIGIGISLINMLAMLLVNAMTWGNINFDPAVALEPFDFATLYGSAALSMLVNLVIYSIGSMAIAAAAEATLIGEPLTATQAVARSIGRSPWAALTGVLVGVCVGFGALLCCLPAIPLAIMLVLAVPLVYLERLGPVDAMNRSYHLVFNRGPVSFEAESSWLRVLIVGIVTVVVVYVIAIAASIPLLLTAGMATIEGQPQVQTALGPQPVSLAVMLPLQLIGAVIQGMFVAISIIPWTLMYYDIRARYEGLDLQREIDALGAETP
jgi:hypothetical protein